MDTPIKGSWIQDSEEGADKNTKNNNGSDKEANNTTKIILTGTGR